MIQPEYLTTGTGKIARHTVTCDVDIVRNPNNTQAGVHYQTITCSHMQDVINMVSYITHSCNTIVVVEAAPIILFLPNDLLLNSV